MQEVLIDVTRLLGRFMEHRLPTGVDRVSLAYIEHYKPSARAAIRFFGRHWVASSTTSANIFNWLLAPTHDLLNWRVHLWATYAFYYHLFHKLPSSAILFNTGHIGLDRVTYAQEMQQLGAKPIFMVHDLIPVTHPEYCRAGDQQKHIQRMNTILHVASGVITNSQFTLNELENYAMLTSKRMPPAVAALLAPAKLPAPNAARPLENPYFVMLGTIEPRKNHWMLLQVWLELSKLLGHKAPMLVIIGQHGWSCDHIIDALDHSELFHKVVVKLPSCSDSDLATWLYHAQALLFPSFIEGYGMPLVEALSLGTPVIASNLSVFKEIAGELPHYLDPHDEPAWLAQVLAYTNNTSSKQAAQLNEIKNFVTPTWEAHFAKVDAWLATLNG